MNLFEQKATKHLEFLRETFGVSDVKSEFEAQGMELDELIRLKRVVSAAGLGITLKVGGAEDVWGVKQALLVGVQGIVFPMIESPYALSKSLGVVKDYITPEERLGLRIAINIETDQAHQNLKAILGIGKVGGLDAVTLGRVDFVGSLGLGRNDINSDRVLEIAQDICFQVKRLGFTMTIGGGIEAESYQFLLPLLRAEILDRFETRMIVFPVAAAFDRARFEEAVRAAHQFELLWLEAMNHQYGFLVSQNTKRLAMLRGRVGVV